MSVSVESFVGEILEKFIKIPTNIMIDQSGEIKPNNQTGLDKWLQNIMRCLSL